MGRRAGEFAWPERCSAAMVGQVYQVTRQAVEKWVRGQGCPMNADGSFNLGAVAAWREHRAKLGLTAAALPPAGSGGGSKGALSAGDDGGASAVARKQAAQAGLLEAELGQTLGVLVLREEVAAQAGQVVTGFRSRLEGWPAVLSPRLANLGEMDIAAVLRTEVRVMLGELQRDFQRKVVGAQGAVVSDQ